MRVGYYTKCWNCDCKIKDASGCNYIKTRDGNLNLCDKCYSSFLEDNKKLFVSQKGKDQEIERSLHFAMDLFHDKIMEDHEGEVFANRDSVRAVLKHTGSFSHNCESCKEILNYRRHLNNEKLT